MEATKKQSQNYPFLKKVSKCLVMVSLCSIILSYSSFLTFLENNLIFSVYIFLQLSTYTIGKNCMFLVCNGILVIIVKNSGLIENPQLEATDSHSENSLKSGVEQVQVLPSIRASVAEEIKQVKVAKEIRASSVAEEIKQVKVVPEIRASSVAEEVRQVVVTEIRASSVAEDTKQVKVVPEIRTLSFAEKIEDGSFGKEENVILIGEYDKDEEEEKKILVVDDEEDEETGLISREELNKKCEDFIRMMRRELSLKLRQ
ncbi:uncharacterized protein LOC110806536 [Carica papaya]|uniref:uncharacterized protein LOC110806536 n=1 Tax=Carica papaya TaxID=3649 RepID=UPI000B8CF021|nr:uncharacterized protein LOC110806536 [Carica papaya]